jgi:hypothetical protein
MPAERQCVTRSSYQQIMAVFAAADVPLRVRQVAIANG